MTDKKIFVAEKCRVGFQLRQGTFTNLLAYVIYYDAKGKIRKEPSWKQWCKYPDGFKERFKEWGYCSGTVEWGDHVFPAATVSKPLPAGSHNDTSRLEPLEFANEPTRGFVLNKGVQRCWSSESNRSMIRVYDPRGWEFEITPDNLIKILMHVDCCRREIADELVYAWQGPELLLLPCSSTVYREAKNFTALQGQRIMVRDLQKGWTYTTKREERLIYLGRHPWHEMKTSGDGYESKRVRRMAHVFCDGEGRPGPVASVPAKIAAVDTPHCHDQYAEWLDAYLKSPRASALTGWRQDPVSDPGERASVSCCIRNGEEFRAGTLYFGGERSEGHLSWRLRDLELKDGETAFVPDDLIRPDGSVVRHRDTWSYARNRYDGQSSVTLDQVFHLVALYENGSEEQRR